jgi:hypothetical protein
MAYATGSDAFAPFDIRGDIDYLGMLSIELTGAGSLQFLTHGQI